MIRLIKFLFLAALAVILAVIALANKDPVTMTLLPPGLEAQAGMNFTWSFPLFIIVFASIVAGLAIGFFWVWLRSLRHGQQARKRDNQVRDLRREVSRLKSKAGENDDEILNLLDTPPAKAS